MNTNLSISRVWIIVLVIVLTVVATLACTPSLEGIFGSAPAEPSGDDVADSSDDDAVPPATATATEAIPVSPSPTPTREQPGGDGVFERAFYDPAADLGPPDEHDAFDGSNPLFFERWNDNSAAWYGSDGRYHITYTFEDKWVWYWTDVYGIDFYADVVVINADTCVEGDSAGLIFRGRLDVDAGYMFGVTCGGSYFTGATLMPGSGGYVCWIGQDDSNCDPGAAASNVVPSEFINAGPGAANRLGVMADLVSFTFYINGHEVLSVTRTSSTLIEGYFGLYLGTAQEYTAEALFDDFSLWNMP
jgi:hypothetical protein